MFNLLLMTDEQFAVTLNKYACGELEALPDGFESHALWLQWRDRPKRKDLNPKGIGPLVEPALAYIAWCRAELIDDPEFIITVRDAYGLLDVDSVWNWIKRFHMPAIPEHPTDTDGIEVKFGMVFAGAAYEDLH